MRLLLEGKNGNKNMTLENVKEYNESVHDRKIYVSYNDDRENESYSMIQYMAVPLNWLIYRIGGIDMIEVMEQRLEAKKRRLAQLQEYFQIDMKNINSSTYEDNAISALLEMKKIKTEIAELEFCLQLK